MADNRYGESRGSSWSDRDRERGRWRGGDDQSWRDSERARPGWGSAEERGRFEDDDRGERGGGFFERAGQEIRSWFSDDDDDRRGSDQDRSRRDFGQGQSGMRGHAQGWGEGSRGDNWRSPSHQRQSSGYGREHGFGGFQGDYEGRRGQGGFGGQGDWRGGRQSFSGDRGESGRHFGYNDMSGMMGGFGNQRFGSSQDDHYLSWRNKQLEDLDRDYQDYCRENEQQFHQNFDSWRQNRKSQGGEQSGGMSATGEARSASASTSGSTSSGSFIGGSNSDPSAATAGGGGDPTPQPASTGSSKSSRSRS